jgi:hypothetical protein
MEQLLANFLGGAQAEAAEIGQSEPTQGIESSGDARTDAEQWLDADIADQERLRRHIDERRELARRQTEVNDQQFELCNTIQRKKPPTVEEKLQRLATIDSELYNYIRALERISTGIWCDRCKAAKTVHVDVAEELGGVAQ